VITKFVEITSVTTEFTDIPPKDNTLISPKLIHVIIGIAEVLHEDLPDRLQSMRDIQHAIDLTPGASLPDLPHHKIDPTMHIELKRQVDKLSLKIRQQCFVLKKIHFYKDKFWSYLVTKNVDMIKDVIIHDQSISIFFEDAVMGEHDAFQTINFSSITVKLKGVSPLPLPFAYLLSSLLKQVNCRISLGSYL